MTTIRKNITDTAIRNGWTTRSRNPLTDTTIAWNRDGDTVIIDFDRKTGRLHSVCSSIIGEWKGAEKAARLIARLSS